MRRGKVYRRCTRCGGDVNAERRAADRPTKHERCDGDRATWAYTVDVARPGAPRKQVTRAGFATKREALAALAELQVEADRHGYSEPSRMTVGEYAARWLPAYMDRVRPGTAAAAEYHMRLHVVPRLGSVPLQALDRQTVKAFYAWLGKEGSVRGGGLSPKTVWNAHLVLHALLADAVQDGLLRTNPATRACKAPEEGEAEAWTPDELRCFLDAAAAHRLFAAFRLMAHGGMRRSELLGLRWRHLDLDAGTVTIINTRVKGMTGPVSSKPKSKRSERTIDLDRETVEILREHRGRYLVERLALGLGTPGPDDLVFVGLDHQPLYPDTLSRAFDRIVARLVEHGVVKRITIHGLRHTHGTLLLLTGVPLHACPGGWDTPTRPSRPGCMRTSCRSRARTRRPSSQRSSTAEFL
jgi:integrase